MLNIRLEGDYEFRGDHWAARIPRLAIIAYGVTRDEARRRAVKAAGMMFGYWSERGVAEESLRAAGVDFEEEAGDIGWTQSYSLGPDPVTA